MGSNEMNKARAVAAYLIQKANAMGEGNVELSGNNDLTNLKLQKLLYFAQLEHLKKTGRPLFEDKIEAWQYGPVVKSVYDWLKGCGAYVITELDADLSIADELSNDIKAFLDDFWIRYQGRSAWSLVEETHKAGSPWDTIYRRGQGNHEEIPIQLLKEAVV